MILYGTIYDTQFKFMKNFMKNVNKLKLNLMKLSNSLLVYKKLRGQGINLYNGTKANIHIEYETPGSVCFKKMGSEGTLKKNKMQCVVFLCHIKQMENNNFQITDKC